MVYSPDTKAEVKKMFVIEGKGFDNIANHFSNKPTKQTIANWAKKKNSNGSNWFKERDDYTQSQYESLSPKRMATKILKKIHVILDKPDEDFNVKEADALAKLRVALEKITDKRYQIPMMFELLTDLIKFLRKHYPELANEKFINAIRHFKNELKERLG